jgi:predicted transcriptional regulator
MARCVRRHNDATIAGPSSRKEDTTAYTVQLNDALTAVVDKIAKDQGLDRTEVITRAIALYKYVSEQGKIEDRTLAILEGDQTIEKLTL